ncbi:uncharacterized protein FIBRA_08571 [Fibroporia radiculosa]|uniref:F-box domain-containing protein n=1 Tax=Fibroporia radiculosa TaxID=599839 RepID=J4H589_9APHY|nr:uncharacterized protein FIBRA_08571 [Fibroporia radiculosa]CCM06319.1 predicted protein [Fibroporia radiculosa]
MLPDAIVTGLRYWSRYISRFGIAHGLLLAIARGGEDGRKREGRDWEKAGETMAVALLAGVNATRLPPELCDCIIDYLWDDTPSLAACALTCRAFLPRTRTHTLSSITLVNTAGFTRFERLLKRDSHIAVYVRRLAIVKTSGNHATRPSRVDREWPLLLRTLPRVEDLTLERWMPGEMRDNVAQRLYLHLSRSAIRTLRLVDIHHWKGTDLPRLLCACLRLRELHLNEVRWESCPDKEMFSRSFDMMPPALADIVPETTIEIDRMEMCEGHPCVVAWLLHGPFNIRLRQLRLGFWFYLGVRMGDKHKLLETAGASLQSLVLSFKNLRRSSLRDPNFEKHFALSNNCYLTSLHLHLAFDSWVASDSIECALGCVNLIVRKISPTHQSLQELRISIQMYGASDDGYALGESDVWKYMDEALALFARGRSPLKVALDICDEYHQEPDNADCGSLGKRTAERVVGYLPKLCAERLCLCVSWGRRWSPDAEFGGRLVGERLERILDLPYDTQQV